MDRDDPDDPLVHVPCPEWGGAMVIVATFLRGQWEGATRNDEQTRHSHAQTPD
jgi:hypothetical protein